MTTTDPTLPAAAADATPAIDQAFLADRQAFWGSFTKFVTMGATAIVVLLILMDVFLV